VDRKSITQPAVVAATHQGWNDLGAVSRWNFAGASVDMFAVKGFDSHVWASDETIPDDVTDADERWLDVSPSYSAGTRLNIVALGGLECGTSATNGWCQHNERTMSLSGVHARMTWATGLVKAEGIYYRQTESVRPQITRGYYVEALKSFGRAYVLSRFDYVETESTPQVRALSTGLGWNIVMTMTRWSGKYCCKRSQGFENDLRYRAICHISPS
jgi:hypothetical protein